MKAIDSNLWDKQTIKLLSPAKKQLIIKTKITSSLKNLRKEGTT